MEFFKCGRSGESKEIIPPLNSTEFSISVIIMSDK